MTTSELGSRSARPQSLRVAFVGWGTIARHVAGMLKDRQKKIDVVGVATRSTLPQGGLPEGARHLTAPVDLREVQPDLVVEAASSAAVKAWGVESLRCATGFVVSSTSAFSDDAVLQFEVRAKTSRHIETRQRFPRAAQRDQLRGVMPGICNDRP